MTHHAKRWVTRLHLLAIALLIGALFSVPITARADDGDTQTFTEPLIHYIDVELQVVRAWPVVLDGVMAFVVQATVDGKPAPATLVSITPACPHSEEAGSSPGCAEMVGSVPKFWPLGIDGRAMIAIPIPSDTLSTGGDPFMTVTVTYGLPMPQPVEFEGHTPSPGWYHGAVTVKQPIWRGSCC